MPQATLRVDIPEMIWIGQLTRAHPEATFRVLTALPDEGSGVALAEITAPDPDEVMADMEAYDEIVSLDVLGQPGSTTVVQFETSQPLLLMALQESGALLNLPFEIQDGQAHWSVSATHDRLSDLGEQLEAMGLSFQVESITQQNESDQPLTDRQEALIEAAVENGYYDTPRDCSLTELAEDVGVAKSTASETLHRAEGTIIKQFVESRDLGV